MKVGFACGVFDLFHAGHAIMLEECKEHCDHLILALNDASNLAADKNIPILSIEDRVILAKNSRFVDEVRTYSSEEGLEALLREIQPDVRFLGEDYTDKPITGKELSKSTYFTNRAHGKSTSKLIQTILARYTK